MTLFRHLLSQSHGKLQRGVHMDGNHGLSAPFHTETAQRDFLAETRTSVFAGPFFCPPQADDTTRRAAVWERDGSTTTTTTPM